ncbi:hypothetical protein F5J12DRAFT_820402 [Pisolithus orientalis]|uniref:uncharacterized protein n=1 Tax=Pisolithus orientalis TaxID=936130 RepID=UPI0022256636|nr:uncharacterized protein F5J12DRAFT_820402 [Pisolithus orientalis]KAI6012757.1 hypothetical protein F5J12DRAFT_820402 [Pisolithus orientalis]
MSDMRLPPIESIDPTIHVPWLLDAAEERRKLSEDVVVESNAVSMASLVSCSTHTGRVDVQDRAGGANVAGYRLSTGESAMNSISSGGLHLWNGNTNEVDIRSGQSPPLVGRARRLLHYVQNLGFLACCSSRTRKHAPQNASPTSVREAAEQC